MMSAKFSDFLTPTPLYVFGSDLYYKIHATSLTMSVFQDSPPPSDADIISGSSHTGIRRRHNARATVPLRGTQPVTDDITQSGSAALRAL